MSRAFCCNALDTPYTYNSTNKYIITNKAMKKESGPKTNCWISTPVSISDYFIPWKSRICVADKNKNYTGGLLVRRYGQRRERHTG